MGPNGRVWENPRVQEKRSHMRTASLAAVITLTGLVATTAAQTAQAPPAAEPYKPTVGQSGKDVVWVPTPPELVEKMLDMAKVTPQDYVMDLGSGDGRNIIAAAKRGATAVGVEFNHDMVELSRKQAAAAGVSDKATFIEGDMYEADISKATVLALFLLPHNLNKLTPKFLNLPPGSRIVGNTFAPEGWAADESETVGGECVSWCTSLLWIVPAKAEGTWKLPTGELTLKQEFQMVSGTLTSGGTSTAVSGKLRGDQITFTAGNAEYTGRVAGDAMEGSVKGGGTDTKWTASRARQPPRLRASRYGEAGPVRVCATARQALSVFALRRGRPCPCCATARQALSVFALRRGRLCPCCALLQAAAIATGPGVQVAAGFVRDHRDAEQPGQRLRSEHCRLRPVLDDFPVTQQDDARDLWNDLLDVVRDQDQRRPRPRHFAHALHEAVA